MNKEDSLRAILIEWFRLPAKDRENQRHAEDFAMAVRTKFPDLYKFKYPGGDKYQAINGYLIRHGRLKY